MTDFALQLADFILSVLLLCSSFALAGSIARRITVGRKIPRLPQRLEVNDEPLVSIIVPFRNEEKNLPNLLESLKEQDYENLEIILVDDQSTDDSTKITEDFAKKVRNCKVVTVKDRPEEWVGKTWACEEGFRRAGGEWLLFTDADVQFKKDVVRKSLSYAISNNLELLTLTPRILCRSFWAKLIQPIFHYSLMVLYSPLRVNNPNDMFGYVFGSFFLIRKSTYVSLGRHESVRSSLIEDRAFGALAKQKGTKMMMVYGSESFSSVWATRFADVIHGMERIVSFSVSINPLRGVAFAIAMFVVMVLPFLIVLSALFLYLVGMQLSPILFMLTIIASILVLCASSIEVLGPLKLSPAYILAAPLGGLLFITAVLTASYKNALRKRITWKGREYDSSEVEF
ncbi:MAG: glycosyltransferase [Thaumarchaeota archaeon]|nr:glycosyltransferase [Nitrososphaerota archaeon]